MFKLLPFIWLNLLHARPTLFPASSINVFVATPFMFITLKFYIFSQIIFHSFFGELLLLLRIAAREWKFLTNCKTFHRLLCFLMEKHRKVSINCGFSMVINRKILTINMQHKNIFTVPIKNQWFSSFLCSLLIYTERERSAAASLLMALHRTRPNNPRNVIFYDFQLYTYPQLALSSRWIITIFNFTSVLLAQDKHNRFFACCARVQLFHFARIFGFSLRLFFSRFLSQRMHSWSVFSS